MKAIINGISVEGTPEEVWAFLQKERAKGTNLKPYQPMPYLGEPFYGKPWWMETMCDAVTSQKTTAKTASSMSNTKHYLDWNM